MSSAVIEELDNLIITFNNDKHKEISNDTISHNVLKAYQVSLALGLSLNKYSWHNLNQIKTIIHLKTQLKHGFIIDKHPLHPIARILLLGVYNNNNIFSKLRGLRYIVKQIWEFVLQFNKIYFANYMKTNGVFLNEYSSTPLRFPEPLNLNINMMPFIMSNTFDESKLPSYLTRWWFVIQRCLRSGQSMGSYDESQVNKIGFLTIQESLIDANKTQRRPGLHVETPGNITGAGDIQRIFVTNSHRQFDRYMNWGAGYYAKQQTGGIYMLSNVSNSCCFWNCKIDCDDVIGHLGNIEHLRQNLSDKCKVMMKRNVIYWMTDRTPHEALSIEGKQYRQFFRLVTKDVSVWYEKHSTKNPHGVVLDPNVTTIIKQDKFA
eukprot:171214_1